MYEDLEYVWDAYAALNASRQHGPGGPQALSVADMVAYLDLTEIDDADERMEVFGLLRAMDAAYMTHWAEKHGGKKNAEPRGSDQRERRKARRGGVRP